MSILPRWRARRGHIAGALGVSLSLSLLASATPVAAGGAVFQATSVTANPAITGLGSGWRLAIDASPAGLRSITLRVSRTNAAGAATAAHQTSVSGVTFSCGPKLGSCTLDDTGKLGTYGEVDLAFAATKPVQVVEETCADGATVTGTISTRKGVLTGTLRLATKNSVLGTIRNGVGDVRVPLEIPATARRYQSTGAECPTPPVCPSTFSVRTQATFLSVNRPFGSGPAAGTFIDELPSVETDVRRLARIDWTGSADDLLTVTTKRTLAAATVHLARTAPFLTGSTTFAATDPVEDKPLFGCPRKVRPGTLVMDATLDWPWAPPAALDETLPASLQRMTP